MLKYSLNCKRCRTISPIWILIACLIGLLLKSYFQNYVIDEENCEIHFAHVSVNKSQEVSFFHPMVRCALITAAKHHPKRQVCLYLRDEEPHRTWTKNLPGNVFIFDLNETKIFSDTPLAAWFIDPKVRQSPLFVYHLGDAIRIALLYKRGGVYLDTDVITLRNLDSLHNGLGEQDDPIPVRLNGAVMIFEKRHPYIEKLIYHFVYEFKDSFTQQGPELLTRIRKKYHDRFANATHQDFVQIQGPGIFYPVAYWDYGQLFNASHTAQLRGVFKSAYTVHVWYKMYFIWPPGQLQAGSIMDDMLTKNCLIF